MGTKEEVAPPPGDDKETMSESTGKAGGELQVDESGEPIRKVMPPEGADPSSEVKETEDLTPPEALEPEKEDTEGEGGELQVDES